MNFFICCFKSCLKGENDQEYYDVLELDPRCDQDSIKKQFKKLSLSLHPDKLSQRGVEATAEQKAKFLKVKEAYDVLSDPKRRKLYDELGASGLKLLENPTESNPIVLLRNFQRNRKDRCAMLLLILFIFLSVFLLPILFSLKCDGTLGPSVKWVGIWSPMWIVDILLLFMSLSLLLEKDPQPEEGSPPPEVVSLYTKISSLVFTSLFVLLQIFIMVRLDGFSNWSWYAVFSPWFVYDGLTALLAFPGAFLTTIPPPDRSAAPTLDSVENGEEDEQERFAKKIAAEVSYNEKILEQSVGKKAVVVVLLRIWFAAFLAAKIDQSVDWNWGLVFLPVWIYLTMQYAYAVYYNSWSKSVLVGVDEEAIKEGTERDPILIAKYQQGNELWSLALLSCCIVPFVPLFAAVLLVCRLQLGTAISTFIIILPIFIGIGCSCIAVFCGLCCLSVVDTEEMEKEQAYADPSADGRDNEEALMQTSGEKDKEAGYSPPPVRLHPSVNTSGGGGGGGGSGGGNNTSPYGTFEEREAVKDEKTSLPAKTTGIDVDID